MQKNKPQKGDIYIHYKDQDKKYEIVSLAFDTESEKEVVVYKPLYEPNHLSGTEMDFFVREINIFMEDIEIEGNLIPRFKKK